MGLGQAGLNNNTASTSNFGLRATLGMTYTAGDTIFAGYYRSPLAIKYKNMVQYDTNSFHSPTFEQPQEVSFGVANHSLMNGDLLLAADFIWKDWESAESYQDLYDNQNIYAIGAQLKTGNLKWRAGFIHADSPIKQNVGSNVGDITSLLVGGVSTPMNPALTRYVQATNAEVIWEDQVTVGLGWDATKHLTIDGHISTALERDETIGETRIEASSWQAGVALTWQFDQ